MDQKVRRYIQQRLSQKADAKRIRKIEQLFQQGDTPPDTNNYVSYYQLAPYAFKSELPQMSNYYTRLQSDGLYISKDDRPIFLDKYSKAESDSKYALKTQLPVLTSYALKSEIPVLTSYALKSEIPTTNQFALKTEIPVLTQYALKTDIPDLTPFALKTQLPNLQLYVLKDSMPNFQTFALKDELPSLVPYALKTDLPVLTPYALKTEIPSLEQYALKTELPNLSPYALKSEIPASANLTQYYTIQQSDQIFARKTDIPEGADLTAYYTKTVIDTRFPTKQYLTDFYLTSAQIFTSYLPRSESPDLSAYVTSYQLYQQEQQLNQQVTAVSGSLNQDLSALSTKVDQTETKAQSALASINPINQTLQQHSLRMDNIEFTNANQTELFGAMQQEILILKGKLGTFDPDLMNFRMTQLENQVQALTGLLNNIYTKAQANALFAPLSSVVDTSQYYTKNQTDSTFATKAQLPEFSDYYTASQCDNKFVIAGSVYDRESADVKFALKTEVPSLSNYFTKIETQQQFTAADTCYTKQMSDDKFALLTSVPDVSIFYTKAESNTRFSLKSEETDLSFYYTKVETDAKYLPSNSLAQYFTALQCDQRYVQPDYLNQFHYTKQDSDGRYPVKAELEQYETKTQATTSHSQLQLAINSSNFNISSINNNLSTNYYTQQQVNNLFSLKTDALSLDTVYTKTDADSKFATNTNLNTANNLLSNNTNSIQDLYNQVSLKADRAYTDSQLALKGSQESIDACYTKIQADQLFQLAGSMIQYYTKTYIDANFYTQQQSDSRYGTLVAQTDLITRLPNFNLANQGVCNVGDVGGGQAGNPFVNISYRGMFNNVQKQNLAGEFSWVLVTFNDPGFDYIPYIVLTNNDGLDSEGYVNDMSNVICKSTHITRTSLRFLLEGTSSRSQQIQAHIFLMPRISAFF